MLQAAQRPDQSMAVHARHADVGNDHVVTRICRRLQRQFRVAVGIDVGIFHQQQLFHHFQHIDRVIHQQDTNPFQPTF
ncbi:hypothetical protein D3C81_1120150 [compost metagenome]